MFYQNLICINQATIGMIRVTNLPFINILIYGLVSIEKKSENGDKSIVVLRLEALFLLYKAVLYKEQQTLYVRH